MEHDPVCGMEIIPQSGTKAEKTDYKGKTYYFCSTSCKDKFIQAPVKYVKKDDNQSGHHH
ncbi:MAG: YHS domain-containing protein [Bacteroidetes bacterium]|nr:YHS domain-containing protein [Bacteroidota bacterium]